VTHLPFPHEGQEKTTLKILEDNLKKGDVAAFILEPLVQGAGGMRMYAPQVLKAMAELCARHDALLIADEVMTGFGRTGEIFACQKSGVQADIVCLSKGLTGGFLPMGATLCTGAVYDAFYHDDRSRMFFHSSSFTGNPLSCAAALANLDVWEQESPAQNIRTLMGENKKAVQWFGARPDVENVRTLGTIFAMDVKTESAGYLSDIAPDLYGFYMENDVLLRPLGNTVYILPPYCVTKEDVEKIYDTLWRSLDYIRDEAKQRAA
jgi:adenosylmethionine-8-amino-7-oxononanoate aminotransferase